MDLFNDMLKDNESLFKNESVLDFEYLPEEMPHRENQQQYVADCIKPLEQGRQGKSLLIRGAPGIGKTTCVKYVFRELEEHTDDIKSVFVNCWRKQTTNSILTDIASQLGSVNPQSKTNEDLWEQIRKMLHRFKGIAIALDEIDKAKEYDFLYQIVENIPRFTLFMITNEKGFLATMDQRIRSRIVVEELEFPPYKKHEIEEILERRKKDAFAPGTWGKEAFDLVVERCSSHSDIRAGLVLMREAGRGAEKKAAKKIQVEHVMNAKAGVVDAQIESSSALDEREKKVLKAIKENPGIETGKLTNALRSEGLDIPDSTLRRILQKLDKGSFIFRESAQGENGGQTMRHYVDE